MTREGGDGGVTVDAPAAVGTVSRTLRSLREDPGIHWFAVILALLAGLGLASVHWLGLVAGGALVGVLAHSLRRALLAGLGFGVLVVFVWGLLFVSVGTFGKVVAMGELAGLGILIALVLPVFGSLVRGVV